MYAYMYVYASMNTCIYIDVYIHVCICVDMGCSPEDLPGVMVDKEGWQERVRDIRVNGVT